MSDRRVVIADQDCCLSPIEKTTKEVAVVTPLNRTWVSNTQSTPISMNTDTAPCPPFSRRGLMYPSGPDLEFPIEEDDTFPLDDVGDDDMTYEELLSEVARLSGSSCPIVDNDGPHLSRIHVEDIVTASEIEGFNDAPHNTLLEEVNDVPYKPLPCSDIHSDKYFAQDPEQINVSAGRFRGVHKSRHTFDESSVADEPLPSADILGLEKYVCSDVDDDEDDDVFQQNSYTKLLQSNIKHKVGNSKPPDLRTTLKNRLTTLVDADSESEKTVDQCGQARKVQKRKRPSSRRQSEKEEGELSTTTDESLLAETTCVADDTQSGDEENVTITEKTLVEKPVDVVSKDPTGNTDIVRDKHTGKPSVSGSLSVKSASDRIFSDSEIFHTGNMKAQSFCQTDALYKIANDYESGLVEDKSGSVSNDLPSDKAKKGVESDLYDRKIASSVTESEEDIKTVTEESDANEETKVTKDDTRTFSDVYSDTNVDGEDHSYITVSFCNGSESEPPDDNNDPESSQNETTIKIAKDTLSPSTGSTGGPCRRSSDPSSDVASGSRGLSTEPTTKRSHLSSGPTSRPCSISTDATSESCSITAEPTSESCSITAESTTGNKRLKSTELDVHASDSLSSLASISLSQSQVDELVGSPGFQRSEVKSSSPARDIENDDVFVLSLSEDEDDVHMVLHGCPMEKSPISKFAKHHDHLYDSPDQHDKSKSNQHSFIIIDSPEKSEKSIDASYIVIDEHKSLVQEKQDIPTEKDAEKLKTKGVATTAKEKIPLEERRVKQDQQIKGDPTKDEGQTVSNTTKTMKDEDMTKIFSPMNTFKQCSENNQRQKIEIKLKTKSLPIENAVQKELSESFPLVKKVLDVKQETRLMKDVRLKWKSDGIQRPDQNLTYSSWVRKGIKKGTRKLNPKYYLEGNKRVFPLLWDYSVSENNDSGTKSPAPKKRRTDASSCEGSQVLMSNLQQEIAELQTEHDMTSRVLAQQHTSRIQHLKKQHVQHYQALRTKQNLELRQYYTTNYGYFNQAYLEFQMMLLKQEHVHQQQQLRSMSRIEMENLTATLDEEKMVQERRFELLKKPKVQIVTKFSQSQATLAQYGEDVPHTTAELWKAPCRSNGVKRSLVQVCLPTEIAGYLIREDEIYDAHYVY